MRTGAVVFAGKDTHSCQRETINEACLPVIEMKTGRLLWWLLAGTRGGANRAKIIIALHDMPSNANQLALLLNLDYKTIRHHLDILVKHGILATEGDGYGMLYFLSKDMECDYPEFEAIWERIGKTRNKESVDHGGENQ